MICHEDIENWVNRMNEYEFGKIIIKSLQNITEEMVLLHKELGSNQELTRCKEHVIYIENLERCLERYIVGMQRVYHNPVTGHEIWRDKEKTVDITSNIISVTRSFSSEIYYRDREELYGCLRGKLCELIRKEALATSLYAIHAALLRKGDDIILIVGNKGSGKTSSALRAYFRHWDILTDELIFVDRDKQISALKRYPALSGKVLERYFSNYPIERVRTIRSAITGEQKELLKLPILYEKTGINVNCISSIYILPNNRNCFIEERFKRKIFLNNFIPGNLDDTLLYQNCSSLYEKCKMILLQDAETVFSDSE
jgi:hypothetical protein